MTGYIFTDTETTGLDETKDRITQIAAIRTDENFKHRGEFKMHIYLPDEVELSDYAREITGITRESLQREPPEEIVIRAYLDFCYSDDPLVFAAYNKQFDMRMIIAACHRHPPLYTIFKQRIKTPAYCVMKAAEEHLPDVPRIYREDGKYSQYKLELVAKHLGIRIKPHDALEDIAATLKIAKHIRRIKS